MNTHEGIHHVSTMPGMTMSSLSCLDGKRDHHWSGGEHMFRQLDNQWYRKVGLGNWAKTSEPIRGEITHRPDMRRRIFYGDPNTYALTWTEYEEVGALDETFWVVFDGTEVALYELSSVHRAAFENALDKRAFMKETRWLYWAERCVPHDRSRDNPQCVIYIDEQTK